MAFWMHGEVGAYGVEQNIFIGIRLTLPAFIPNFDSLHK